MLLPDVIDLKLRDLKNKIYENKYELKEWSIQEVKRNKKNNYTALEKEKSFLTGNQSFWDNTGKIFFFQHKATIPQKIDYNNLYLHLDIDGECTLFINDEVYRGINEKNIKLPKVKNNQYKFKILATHDVHLSVRHPRLFNVPYPPHIFRKAFLFNKNKKIENLYILLKNIKNTFNIIESKTKKHTLHNLLIKAFNIIDFYTSDRGKFIKSINNSYKYLINELKTFKKTKEGKVFLLAHSHLDLAFKWTITDTIRKLERTISTTLNLMESNDNYYYIQSQAILYDYLKEFFPNLFEQVKKKYDKDRFIIEGSFWVESDINLPNGESLIRQILYGKNFYKNNFDKNTNVAWLPDCFGFSAILPQILKKSEIDYFITTKLQWNDTNTFPYNIFNWEGIDKTQISAYLLTDEYGGNLDPKKIYKAWERRKQKDLEEVLSLYGYGDGGGGNTEEQLNNYNALKKIPYLPKIKTNNINKHLKTLFNENDLPTWKGELYLEKHRGTYTTQAKLKKYNRRLEFKLRNIDLLYSIAKINNFKEIFDLKKLWKILLKNQFHDIITGSCVHDVYDDAVKDYDNLNNNLEEKKNKLFNFFSHSYNVLNNEIIVFNPLSFDRADIIKLDKNNLNKDYELVQIDDKKYPVQKTKDNYYIKMDNLKSLDFTKLTFINSNKKIQYKNNLKSDKNFLENKYIKLTLDSKGQIKSIFDKEKEIEYIKENKKANQFVLYDDKSTYFDSWDISISEENKRIIDNIKNIKIKSQGPFFHSIEIKRDFYNSSILQEIILYGDKRKIDFKTKIDWQENQKLLRTVFPFNIINSKALFDLSMGYIERTNYKNTGWEKAKTEVPAHKWVNLNNSNLSVSLLNDSKYGHEVNENVINLTLLKSGIFPDPKADLGTHKFNYSLLLNPSSIDLINIERQALMMNNKPIYYNNTSINTKNEGMIFNKIFDIENENVLLDSFKIAENKEGYILRVHEFEGISKQLKINLYKEVKEIYETNLLENEIKKINDNKKINMKIEPFEIKTFRIIFA